MPFRNDEVTQVRRAITPADIDGGVTGDYVKMSDYRVCTVYFNGGDSAAGADLTFTLTQAKDNAGTGVKALAAIGEVFYIQAVDDATVATTGTWTRDTQTEAGTYELTDSGTTAQMFMFTVRAEDLDTNNDFTHIKVAISDPTVAKIATMSYIMSDARQLVRLDGAPSVIA